MSNNPFGHIMVDIETMGNKSNSAIVSIAAVEFNLETGKTGKMSPFYQKISLQSCLDAGLKVNADTVLWWMKQNETARLELADNKNTYFLAQGLQNLSEYLRACNITESQIWGNSARFDLGLLSDAYNIVNLPIPWLFRNERCVRTLVSFNPSIKDSYSFEGVVHNPIDDCLHQIKYCSAIWTFLKKEYEPDIKLNSN